MRVAFLPKGSGNLRWFWLIVRLCTNVEVETLEGVRDPGGSDRSAGRFRRMPLSHVGVAASPSNDARRDERERGSDPRSTTGAGYSRNDLPLRRAAA